jgi:hypothetical protein
MDFIGLLPGRIVHYVQTNNIHMAALVVEVDDQTEGICRLRIFGRYPASDSSRYVKYSINFEVNTWHWIEKE